jgi:predicted nucleic acid-binding protein
MPVPTNDIWIAATAIQHHLTLFTFDAHFARVPDLSVGRVPLDFEL